MLMDPPEPDQFALLPFVSQLLDREWSEVAAILDRLHLCLDGVSERFITIDLDRLESLVPSAMPQIVRLRQAVAGVRDPFAVDDLDAIERAAAAAWR